MPDFIYSWSEARGKAKPSPFQYQLLWKSNYLKWLGTPCQTWMRVCANDARMATEVCGVQLPGCTCRILITIYLFYTEQPAVP